jgi:hypothetical protein
MPCASTSKSTTQSRTDEQPLDPVGGVLGKARAVANRAFAETIPVEADGHGNGHHGNGHAVTGEEHEAVGAPGSEE